MKRSMLILTIFTIAYLGFGEAFVPHAHSPQPIGTLLHNPIYRSSSFAINTDRHVVDRSGSQIYMVAKKSGKKKRRRRKDAPVPTEQTQQQPQPTSSSPGTSDEQTMSLEELQAIASFRPTKSSGDTTSTVIGSDLADVGSSAEQAEPLVDLPDIRDALRRKEMKKIEEEIEEKQEKARPKISRKDKKAFLQLLEEQPFADADDSYFEEEKYGTVSALLAEKAKPFLGIPPGPLQVGHFIGALVIILMAFVEYPGFPLTNLPTPLRECFQGGLATVYSINIVIAVIAALKAPERGQSSALWAAKAFSVGGLALDQLTQLPTLEESQRAKK